MGQPCGLTGDPEKEKIQFLPSRSSWFPEKQTSKSTITIPRAVLSWGWVGGGGAAEQVQSRLKVKLLKLSFRGEIEVSQEIVKLAKRRRNALLDPEKLMLGLDV